MFVLDSGFEGVKSVALGAAGMVAALRDGEWQDNAHEDENALGRWAARLWQSPNSEPLLVRDYEGVPFGLTIDPISGTLLHGNEWHGLVMADGRICTPHESHHCGDIAAFALRPDGSGFVLGCEFAQPKGATYPNRLVLFERSAGERSEWKQVGMAEGSGFTFSHLAFFSDGERFAAVEWSKRKDRRNGGYERGMIPTLRIHHAASLEVFAAQRFVAPVESLLVCGEHVLVLASPGLLKVWDAGLQEKPDLIPQFPPCTAIAAGVHGRCLFTASGSKVTRWDVSNWKPADTYDWQIGPIACLAVSPDGLTAAAGSSTGKVAVWDVE